MRNYEVINLDGDEMNSNKKPTIFDMMKSSKVLKKSEKYDLLNSAINDSNFKNYFKQTDPNYAEVMKALTPISSVHNSTSSLLASRIYTIYQALENGRHLRLSKPGQNVMKFYNDCLTNWSLEMERISTAQKKRKSRKEHTVHHHHHLLLLLLLLLLK